MAWAKKASASRGARPGRPKKAKVVQPGNADDLLNRYLKLLSALPLFTPEEEADSARRLREKEIESWALALYLPATIDYLSEAENLSNFEGCDQLNQLRRRYQRSGIAADGAPRRAAKIREQIEALAEALRDFDSDRQVIDRCVEHLRSSHPAHAPTQGRSQRRGVAPDRPSRVQIRQVLRVYTESIELRNRFVRANLRLVVSVARNFHHYKLPLVDLVQEGNLGLIKAVHRFDHRRGFRFSTYAHWWIRQSIERAIVNKGSQVRVPVHVFDTRRQINRAIRNLTQDLGRAPTDEEIADYSDLPIEKVVVTREHNLRTPLSLDDVVSDSDERNFGDLLADNDAPQPDEAVMQVSEVQRVRKMLALLSPIEMDVICRRFGLLGDNDETLEQIGRKYNLSRERVRQIQVQGLKKMRRFCDRRQIGA